LGIVMSGIVVGDATVKGEKIEFKDPVRTAQ
jgi:hypothetical protein